MKWPKRKRKKRTVEQHRADKETRRRKNEAWDEGRKRAQAAIDERVEAHAQRLEELRRTRTHWRGEFLPFCWKDEG